MLNQIKTFKEFLLSETIQFSNRASYGQIVILTGGPGSGKSFVKDWFLDVSGYKTRDVDEYKVKYLKNIQRKANPRSKVNLTDEEQEIFNRLKDHGGDIKKFLSVNENGSLIHMFVNNRLEKRLSETDHKIKDKVDALIKPIIQKHLKYEEGIEYLDAKIFPELKQWFFTFLEEIYISIFRERPSASDISKDIILNIFPKFEQKIKSLNNFNLLEHNIIEGIKGLVKIVLDNEESYPKDLLIRHNAASKTGKENLPNLLFDISFKDTWYMETIIPKFIETGYDPKNIHMVWILTDLELSELRNNKRDRVMATSYLHEMHAGVLKSMLAFLINDDNLIPKYLNGDIYIINNDEITIPKVDDRTKKDITQQYTDGKGRDKFIFKAKDIQKIKVKNAGSARIDLSKLNNLGIVDVIHKNISRLNDNSKNIKNKNFQTSIEHSKEIMNRISK